MRVLLVLLMVGVMASCGRDNDGNNNNCNRNYSQFGQQGQPYCNNGQQPIQQNGQYMCAYYMNGSVQYVPAQYQNTGGYTGGYNYGGYNQQPMPAYNGQCQQGYQRINNTGQYYQFPVYQYPYLCVPMNNNNLNNFNNNC